MRVLVTLVGAVAALAGSAVARALPEAEVSDVAAAKLPPNEASADTFYCGYVYSERGLRGETFPLVVGTRVIYNALSSYIISGECECKFSDPTGSQTVVGPVQGDLFRALSTVNCVHVGPGRRDEAKGLEAKDLAVSAKTSPEEASPDTIYCGYVYRATNLRGVSTALVAGANTKGYVNSYIISGECLCTFRIGYPGAESTPVLLKGPQQGNLKATAFTTYCEQDGSTKRDEVADVAAPPGAQTQYCGYAYSASGLRGDIKSLAIDMVSGASTQFRSYIISGECSCDFQSGGPSNPGPREVIQGPRQGNLLRDAFQVYCIPYGGTKRSEADDPTPPASVSPPTPTSSSSNHTISCGYANTEHKWLGSYLEIRMATEVNIDTHFRSYSIGSSCICEFQAGGPGHDGPAEVIQIRGPLQGEFKRDTWQVYCFPYEHNTSSEAGYLAVATPTPAPVPVPAPASEDTIYCGYAYTERGLQGDSVDLPAGDVKSVPGKLLQSYRIASNCRCYFHRNLPIPGVADVTGPTNGNLKAAYETVVCFPTKGLLTKRDEPQVLGRAVATREVSAAGFCGYAYAEHGLRGRQVSIPADNRQVHYQVFKSYIISGDCACTFASKAGAVPEHVMDVKGPQQGEISFDAENVVCKGPGF